MSDLQSLYQKALRFAAGKHAEQGQLVPGSQLPYAVHISNVAMEILAAALEGQPMDLTLAIPVALLHDTLEDTATTFEEISSAFGEEVAGAVLALTKNAALPKEAQMPDSLRRIQEQRPEVWAVKLADRITNLQQPPGHWTLSKKQAYQQEAQYIADTLSDGNAYL
ncbi:MAG: bifunctional (p)ppGpp synthetase/guanosine-3',5'-bis(diphosphate) 3'-pyrophosphohydrolase, partial [Bacteroidetes bacterium]